MPTVLLIRMVCQAISMLNAFATSSGIAGGFLPRELVQGTSFSLPKECKAPIGSHIEASNDKVITNDNSHRTDACIALDATSNRQGGVSCFSLKTGKVVERRTVSVLPYPASMLKRVAFWGKKAKDKITKQSMLQFRNRKGDVLAGKMGICLILLLTEQNWNKH